MEIILASKSPRRKELLRKIIPVFSVEEANVDEIYPSSLTPTQIPTYLAKLKANEVFSRHKDALVIAADTIVSLDDIIFGKPKDKEDAIRMMRLLSGRTHHVITGVCIQYVNKKKVFHCVTSVTFHKLSEEEIEDYSCLDTIYDKAGAYAIQGEAGKFIDYIRGDYYNVVGLPLAKLYQAIKEIK